MKTKWIKSLGLLFTAAAATVWLAAQEGRPAAQEGRPLKVHIVGGERHGASFFPLANYAAIEPKVKGEMDFAHYHTYGEVVEFLRRWEKEYPNLVAVYSVGRSFEGRDIWQITITNISTGPDTAKPAMFLEGNRHSGEVTGAESALWFAHHVLTSYGRDAEITRLVDTKALYIRVKNNPDGSELYLQTAQSNRSTVRPHDSDRDGLLDEDPGEDLDGDGFLLQMRQKVEDGKGDMVVDPDDPTGRLMKRVGQGKGNYRGFSEGVDNDGDGRYNEDGIGGLDLHRNYPENWRPEPGLDLTGRGWTQGGAGAYPLSETETRAVVTFLLQHPNVSVVQTMDTTVPMHLRPPSTSRSEESMFPEDLKLYQHFDQEGKKITGYPYAGAVYWEYANLDRGFRREGERPREQRGFPLFGHSPDFGYFQFGAIWYGDELWNGGRGMDYDGDGRITELESLRWLDETLPGKYFKPWTKFNHPQLGEVEIGGFNPKFFRQNPPPEVLEEWAKKEALFNLLLAKSLPQGKLVSVEVKPVRREAGFVEVTAVVTNEGFLPTALEMAKRVKIVRPDTVELRLKGAELAAGMTARQEVDSLRSQELRTVKWKVKVAGEGLAEAEVVYSSTRGGVDQKKVKLS
ncbi:MAG: M14 family metallopeptidase [Candidatus Aminicenantes bacterium]|nr:M14 family metallopeptidase [Candidatus Aminicenantes bacterium]